jgi:hypothetical protein
MSKLVIDQYTRTISGTSANSQARIPVTGSSVRCVSATVDFQISFDNSPFVPFGQAREIAPKNRDGTPYQFQNVTVKIADGVGTSNTIVLVVGDCDYADNRTELYPNQTVRAARASALTSILYTSVSAVAPQALGGAAGTNLLVNVRNTHATNAARLSTSTANLTAGEGYILGPGENVDLPLDAALYALSPVGTTLNVSLFAL